MTIDHQIASLGKANLLGYFEHASAEWHEARKGVAGSLISSIMGHNPWRSAYTAYHEVLGLLDRESDGPSMAMKLGTVFEQPIKDLWISENKEWFIYVLDSIPVSLSRIMCSDLLPIMSESITSILHSGCSAIGFAAPLVGSRVKT